MYLKGLTTVTVTTKSVLYFKVDELDNVTSSMYNVLKTKKTNLNIKLKKLTRSKLKKLGTVSPRFCFLQKLTFNHSLVFLFAMLFLNYTFCFGSLIKRWWTTKSFPGMHWIPCSCTLIYTWKMIFLHHCLLTLLFLKLPVVMAVA